MKKFVCVVIALLLVAASVAVLYSGLMYKLFPDEALVVYEKVDGKRLAVRFSNLKLWSLI